ncbi:unnamed protein product [Rotaria magnacalcarata]|uniref:Uncharacterized protein n=2 Tax=Rotaria magnacalcarata TaxID=392030 RepID=A0A815K4C0_9BILA|nr:unnamed protein product [Rotaria magnacalcarata]CAF1449610.1 unnamed protein product [Rotaria magnacalcarata]CAF2082412.1 unnamed protein product [Rotaria magnacalcarata]CAF2170680.1 unnamed protein product [Rotaria magnacalcarata]CAF2258071.1 unnamed protein product [Rotaria magnacalcarata]
MSSSNTEPISKTILAADIAEARIAGIETPADDPRKKADAENQGWMSGDQFTISETPVAHLNAVVGTKQ